MHVNISQANDTGSFAEWFKGSRVTDASGAPLVMFHGTKAPGGLTEPGDDGTCFTSLRSVAARYAGRLGRIFAVHLAIKNPYVTDVAGWNGEGGAWSPASIKGEASLGLGDHDGYIVTDWAGRGHDLVIAFSLSQIRQIAGT